MQEKRRRRRWGAGGVSGHRAPLPCFARRSLELSVPLSLTRVS